MQNLKLRFIKRQQQVDYKQYFFLNIYYSKYTTKEFRNTIGIKFLFFNVESLNGLQLTILKFSADTVILDRKF